MFHPLAKIPAAVIDGHALFESAAICTYIADCEPAADLIAKAIIRRPSRIATRMGLLALAVYETMPRLSELMMNTSYNMFGESKAALGNQESPTENMEPTQPSSEQRLLMGLLKGVQW